MEQRSDGDAHRWSPAVVAAFLEWSLRTEIASDEDDEALVRDLEAWIRYAHRVKEWPSSITDEALLRLETHLNPSADPAELWGQALGDGIEAMADELGLDLDDDDSLFPLFDAWGPSAHTDDSDEPGTTSGTPSSE